MLLFLQRFFFVFAITIPFDIRDIKYDSKKLKTLPIVFGEYKARQISLLSLGLYEITLIFQFFFGEILTVSVFVGLLLTSAITSLFLLKSTSDKGEIYFSFWVEGTSLMMYFCLIISHFFF